ncbi:MAG TPA: nucleotidyltransferase [Nitrospiria bacterium]|nr:nucleotidyltransferase [Nitrospiria bacterium]
MINEQDVLKIVTQRLESAGIRYMVTGSIAANFYTIPRMTRDIDIIIEVGEEKVEELFSLFSNDFYVDRDVMRHALQSKGMFNIIHREGVVKVDFIVRKDSEYRRVEFERRRSIEFEGGRILVASPEDLILSKLDWAKDSRSEMQIRDVKNLLQTPGLDRRYILKWVAKLGLQEVYQEAN